MAGLVALALAVVCACSAGELLLQLLNRSVKDIDLHFYGRLITQKEGNPRGPLLEREKCI